MNKDTYPAETANLDCSLDTTERGFSIEVKGINDKLEILLQTVLNHFEAFEDNLEDGSRSKSSRLWSRRSWWIL